MGKPEQNPLAVFIVGDDADIQAKLRAILECEGCEVESATSVQEVIKQKFLGRFAAIFLDDRLANEVGNELLPYIRTTALNTDVILLTTETNPNMVRDLRHQAVEILSKPIEPEILRFHLGRIRYHYRRQRELAEAQSKRLQFERLAAIGQAMTTFSHETRNELHGMRLGLEILERLLDDPQKALETIRHLRQGQQRLHRLFEDVREFAAPMQLELALTDVREVWRRAWSSLEPIWKSRAVVFEEEIGMESLILCGDAFRLEEVFRNLFENSLAACPDPVRIQISRSKTHDDRSISLVIQDNGPGVSQEQHQNIFEAFYTTKSQGTGLGLAIVKRIIEAHAGTISLGNETIGGAEFVMSLPLNHHCPVASESHPPETQGFRPSVATLAWMN